MKTMNKRMYFMLSLLLVMTTGLKAQVVIGTNVAEPESSAVLDLNSGIDGNLGLLLPRVPLTAEDDDTTIPNPATGLLVYADGTGGLEAGVYAWDGSKWQTNDTSGTLEVDNPVESFVLTPAAQNVDRWETGTTIVASNFNGGAAVSLPYVSWKVVSGADNISNITKTPTSYAFTAAKKGTTVVRATGLDGNHSEDASITVDYEPVTDVTITNPNPLRITIGNPATLLTATVEPDNATRKTLEWTSGEQSIAAIAGSGDSWTVEGSTIGETAITAVTTDGTDIDKQIAVRVYPKLTKPADIALYQEGFPIVLSLPTTVPEYADLAWDDLDVISSNPAVVGYDPVEHTLTFGSVGSYSDISIQFIGYEESTVTFRVTVKEPCTGFINGQYCYIRGPWTWIQAKSQATCPEGYTKSSINQSWSAPLFYNALGNGMVWNNAKDGDSAMTRATSKGEWQAWTGEQYANVLCMRPL
ncbi:MAG: Ig-like domain-containing protein [Candidatus Symbiothrix sp.]|nr:Ig-like domain-containing protein [Candidatus Symbiothrix sp.]